MTRLNKYDKNQRNRDEKILQYYRHDFIYKENMKTRISVIIALGILFILYMVHSVMEGKIEITDLASGDFNYKFFIFKMAIIAVVVLASYTFVSTLQSTKAYQEAQERMFYYVKTMDLLEERRRLHNISLDTWENRNLANTVVIKREVPHE